MSKLTYNKKGDTILEIFLNNLGKSSLDEVNEMFQKSYDDGYLIKDMDKATSLIKKHKEDIIYIFGDYDADGITSTSILYLGLKKLGYKPLYLIPKRHTEGFGLNKGMVDKAVSKGAALIITCDNGTAQTDVVTYAKKRGLDVLITDHHEGSSETDADVIINPNAVKDQCEFTGYCGAGIAYKVIRALLKAEGVKDKTLLNKCLSLCAIGTIADVMELKKENYVFVKNGMKKLQNPRTTTLPLYTLACAFGLEHHMSAKDIGFKLGPVINAQSRLIDDGAMEVVDFLVNENRSYAEITKICEKFISRNDVRKGLKREYTKKANDYISENCLWGDVPIIVRLDDCPEGIIGIIAGHLVEKYRVPVLVLCNSLEDENILKGSGRSVDGYNIYETLKAVDGLSIESNTDDESVFTRYGGHEGACGFSIKKEKFEEFVSLMTANVPEGFKPAEVEEIEYNLEISAKDLNKNIEELERYEPWGNGNPMPVFKVNDFEVVPKNGKWATVVSDTILKLCGTKGTAIGFDMVDKVKKEIKKANLIGQISNNYFNGTITPQVEFNYLEEVESVKTLTPLADKLRKMAEK